MVTRYLPIYEMLIQITFRTTEDAKYD